MTIDRSIEHGHMLPKGAVGSGGGTETIVAHCTGDEDTTAVIKKIGLSRGVVVNKSGEEVRVVYYGALSPNGKAWPIKDKGKTKTTIEQTLGNDDEMVELPDEVASVPWLIPVVTQTDSDEEVHTGTGTGTGSYTSDSPAVLYFQFQD